MLSASELVRVGLGTALIVTAVAAVFVQPLPLATWLWNWMVAIQISIDIAGNAQNTVAIEALLDRLVRVSAVWERVNGQQVLQ